MVVLAAVKIITHHHHHHHWDHHHHRHPWKFKNHPLNKFGMKKANNPPVMNTNSILDKY